MARTPVGLLHDPVTCQTKVVHMERSALGAEHIGIPSSTVAGFTARVCSMLGEAPWALREEWTPRLEAIVALSAHPSP